MIPDPIPLLQWPPGLRQATGFPTKVRIVWSCSAQQGGPRVKVKKVDLVDCWSQPANDEPGFMATCTWNVTGSVGHWGISTHEETDIVRSLWSARPTVSERFIRCNRCPSSGSTERPMAMFSATFTGRVCCVYSVGSSMGSYDSLNGSGLIRTRDVQAGAKAHETDNIGAMNMHPAQQTFVMGTIKRDRSI
jgi:hypothetical protein